MNAAAQNCLLKTLEEPPERTVFFLITDQPAALLPTIVSRCRVVRFHPLTEEACAARLIALGQPPETAKKKARMAEGCVGRALAIDDGQLELRCSRRAARPSRARAMRARRRIMPGGRRFPAVWR